MSIFFDGKAFAQEKEALLSAKFKLLDEEKRKRQLVDIYFSQDSKAALYVGLKTKAAKRIGINFVPQELNDDFSSQQLLTLIERLNNDPDIGGIMLQLPLPQRFSQMEKEAVIEAINPAKDVDCLTSRNLGKLVTGNEKIRPATVEAVWQILSMALPEKVIGRSVVIVGRSDIVGKPLANLLVNQGATVTVCHSQTKNLIDHTARAEILILATDKDKLINQPNMVMSNSIVIDVGSPIGNADQEKISPKTAFITPVPGGVGPVTIVSLLTNFWQLIN